MDGVGVGIGIGVGVGGMGRRRDLTSYLPLGRKDEASNVSFLCPPVASTLSGVPISLPGQMARGFSDSRMCMEHRKEAHRHVPFARVSRGYGKDGRNEGSQEMSTAAAASKVTLCNLDVHVHGIL